MSMCDRPKMLRTVWKTGRSFALILPFVVIPIGWWLIDLLELICWSAFLNRLIAEHDLLRTESSHSFTSCVKLVISVDPSTAGGDLCWSYVFFPKEKITPIRQISFTWWLKGTCWHTGNSLDDGIVVAIQMENLSTVGSNFVSFLGDLTQLGSILSEGVEESTKRKSDNGNLPAHNNHFRVLLIARNDVINFLGGEWCSFRRWMQSATRLEISAGVTETHD